MNLLIFLNFSIFKNQFEASFVGRSSIQFDLISIRFDTINSVQFNSIVQFIRFIISDKEIMHFQTVDPP